MDADPQEKKVSPAIAHAVFTSDPIDSNAGPAPAGKAAVDNSGTEDLAVLFRDHYKTVFRAAYRITGSHGDAEDVLQTVFLRLTPNSARVGLSQNPQGYLYRAAVNASLDLLRKRARANSVSLDVMDHDGLPNLSMGSPEDDLADLELRELIRRAVAKLEGRAAAAFVLRYFEGYDNRRIAEILGTSQLVIGVTLHRARVRLRKEIGSYLEKHHEAQ